MTIRVVTLMIAVASLLYLIGCTTTDRSARGAELETIDWVGLASRWTGPDSYRVEIVTFHDLKNSERYYARYDVEFSHQGLTMVAQTPLGVPIYEPKVAEGKLTTNSHLDQLGELPVERTLADFVLTYWPLDQLVEAAAAAGYSIQQADNIRRLVSSEGDILVEITTESIGNDAMIRVVHHDIPLRIDIRTSSVGQIRQ